MLHSAGAGPVSLAQPPGRHGAKQKKVFPSMDPTPALLQAQLSRAKCEIESLRFLKTDNGIETPFPPSSSLLPQEKDRVHKASAELKISAVYIALCERIKAF
jgi:hypothetical protein